MVPPPAFVPWVGKFSVEGVATTDDDMRVIEISRPGGPEVLVSADRAVPQPQAGEVLIKVMAAGINRPDIFQRRGGYPPPKGASDVPGLEVAGEIVAGDATLGGFALGAKVCALVTGGGYAEYCCAPVVQCLPIPDRLSEIDAAGLPEAYFTVWSNVFDRGGLSAAERLLVHGGASGIGTSAIQLACAFGHEVYATVGSEERCRIVENLGAVRGINYRQQDFVKEVLNATAGRGVDVILDMVAGDYIARNMQCLADDGRMLLIATLGGNYGHLDPIQIMQRRLTITGSTLRSRPVAFKGKIAQALQKKVWPLLESGQVKPIIYATLPLAQAAQAHAMMESGEQVGKIILTI